MSRGIRSNTLNRILAAREREPLAMGPYLGELATLCNMPSSLVAEIVGTHEQTVARWIFGQSEISLMWLPTVAKLLALLTWVRSTEKKLEGSRDEKREQLQKLAKEFKALVRSAQVAA